MTSKVSHAAICLVIFTVFSPLAYGENPQGKDFDSWAKEFRQSLSDNSDAASPAVKSEEKSLAPREEPGNISPVKSPETPAAKSLDSKSLVKTDMDNVEIVSLDTGNVQALERRVTYLERDLRSTSDRLRSLERSVDDLRRRR